MSWWPHVMRLPRVHAAKHHALSAVAALLCALPGAAVVAPSADAVYITDQGMNSISFHDGTGLQQVRSNLSRPVSIELDPEGCAMYYSTTSGSAAYIYRGRLDGTLASRTLVVSHQGDLEITYMRLDRVNGLLYYLLGRNTLFQRNLSANTETSHTLSGPALFMDVDTTVSPPRIYYVATDFSIKTKDLNSTAPDALFFKNDLWLYDPTGLVLDTTNRYVYWCDNEDERIVRAAMSDSIPEQISPAGTTIKQLRGPSLDATGSTIYVLSKGPSSRLMSFATATQTAGLDVVLPGENLALPMHTSFLQFSSLTPACFSTTTTTLTTTTTTQTTTSTTTSSSTSWTSTTTSSSTTRSTSTTSTSTSTRSTTATSTSSTTSGTSTTSTTKTTTSTTTTRTGTSSTATFTTTLHDIAYFTGTCSATAADPVQFVTAYDTNPAVGAALRQGFAGALPGVTPEAVQITSVRGLSGGRRLQGSGGNVAIDYVLRVPAATVAARGLTAESIPGRKAELLTSINTAMTANTALLPLVALELTVPTMEVVPSVTTTSTTLTTSSTTTRARAPHVRVVGTALLQVTGVTDDDVAVAIGAALESLHDLRSGAVSVTVEPGYLASYIASVSPSDAFDMVNRSRIDEVAFRAAFRDTLIDDLVQTGADRLMVQRSLFIRSLTVPDLLDMGTWSVNACGFTCAAGREPTDWAPPGLCEWAFNCSEVDRRCCQDSVPPDLGEFAGDVAGASSAIIAIVVAGAICLSGVCCAAVYIRRKRRLTSNAQKPATNEEVRKPMEILPLPKSTQDKAAVAAVLEDLQGTWCLYEGTQLSPGLVVVQVHGYTLYDGEHFEDQDLVATNSGVARPDGWYVDMVSSDISRLEWTNGEESVTWRRVKDISTFSVGDTVEWLMPECVVPVGSIGEVAGVAGGNLLMKIDEQVVTAQPHQVKVQVLANGHEPEEPPPLPNLSLHTEMKRLALYAQEMTRENTRLSQQNAGLRRELTSKADNLDREHTALSRENTWLRAQLLHAEELRRELTNTLQMNQSNTSLSLENERLRVQLYQADALERELTTLSQSSQRIAHSIHSFPGHGLAGVGATSPPSVATSDQVPFANTMMREPRAGAGIVLLDDFMLADDDSDDTDDEFIGI